MKQGPPNTDDLSKINQADLHKLLDQVDEMIYQYRFNPEDNTSYFQYASRSIINIFEITPEDVSDTAEPLLARIHPEDREEVLAAMEEAKSKLLSWDYEYRVLLPKKGERWVRGKSHPEPQADGTIIFRGSALDITDKKRIEIELFENKERLRLAVESSQDGIWDWNIETNKVFYSKASQNMLGLTQEELEGNSEAWNERVHPDDQKAYYDDIKKHFRGDTQFYINEHRVKRKDGKYIWILDRGKVIKWNKDGKPLRVIGTHSDITDLKQKEADAIKTTGIVAEQNQRLMNFAHIVSHNLRSHSSNFESLLGMMDVAESMEEKMELIDYVKKVSDGLSETIMHLNEVVSVQTNVTLELKDLNLHDIIEKTRYILKADINRKHADITNTVSKDILVRYNPAYLESIILNLISNALKYSHPDRDPVIKLETRTLDNFLVLSLRDNGKGIDLDKYGKNIFGMYKTFHGNDDAKGIGLFITKNQVEAMGGEINVTSEVGKGSIFEVLFKL
ncbi:PAS domain-containing protein [Leeuwenhoekiella sp. A16]|uniref:sensor histidine kinase n=1 Tax=unclassified Leeuwenhoekiella TaxID=2615029 RepID=UPI003A8009A1